MTKNLLALFCLALLAGCATGNKMPMATAPAVAGGKIIIQTATATNQNPFVAGQSAALRLFNRMGSTFPHAVFVTECFEDKSPKSKVLQGVASIFPRDIIFGGAVYGMFTQDGSVEENAVSLLGIGGDGIQVTAALTENMGAKGLSLEKNKDHLVNALQTGGNNLAKQLPGIADGDLMILLGDAHSPKNQYLIDGVQEVSGKKLPITGGSVCKNAGQTFVYYRGGMYTDAAIGLVLKAGLNVSQAGRQAKSNDLVISTAAEGSKTAINALKGKPAAMIVFDCAGRKGKLNRLADELEAIQKSFGKAAPIYGCYCAGEFGPADTTETKDNTSMGRGWHIMLSILGR